MLFHPLSRTRVSNLRPNSQIQLGLLNKTVLVRSQACLLCVVYVCLLSC